MAIPQQVGIHPDDECSYCRNQYFASTKCPACGTEYAYTKKPDDEIRASFERWIGAPPFEHMCDRNSDTSPWPGGYKRYETELAWEAWQAAEQLYHRR